MRPRARKNWKCLALQRETTGERSEFYSRQGRAKSPARTFAFVRAVLPFALYNDEHYALRYEKEILFKKNTWRPVDQCHTSPCILYCTKYIFEYNPFHTRCSCWKKIMLKWYSTLENSLLRQRTTWSARSHYHLVLFRVRNLMHSLLCWHLKNYPRSYKIFIIINIKPSQCHILHLKSYILRFDIQI